MGKKKGTKRKTAVATTTTSSSATTITTLDPPVTAVDDVNITQKELDAHGAPTDQGTSSGTESVPESLRPPSATDVPESMAEDLSPLIETANHYEVEHDSVNNERAGLLDGISDVQHVLTTDDEDGDDRHDEGAEDALHIETAGITRPDHPPRLNHVVPDPILVPKIKSYDLDAEDVADGNLARFIDDEVHHHGLHHHHHTRGHHSSGSPSPRRRRSELLRSAGSSSSLASASGSTSGLLPRTTSLVLNGGQAAVLQAIPSSKTEVVEVVVEQSWLITKLVVQLLWALRMSRKWILMTGRLITFTIFLLPAFLRMVWYWLFDDHVHKNIIYGLKGRNLLDVYTVPSDKRVSTLDATHPATKHPRHPVVVFLSGGAWIIGYKGWGSLMGKVLSSFGIVVVTPDYRNFPQGILPDMVEDASMALQWVFDNIQHFGGDPENVTLIGQSAGAHIAMCTLLEQVEKRKEWIARHGTKMPVASSPTYSTSSVLSQSSLQSVDSLYHAPTWELKQIRSVIGISGPYNIEASIATFHKHGFDKTVVERIMDHKIAYFSPALRVFAYSEHARAQELFEDFPPVFLFHGTADATVSWKSTEQFTHALASCGLPVTTQYFQDKTHTDPIIEDPICGDDFLLDQVMMILQERAPRDEHGHVAFEFADVIRPKRSLYPGFLVRLARYVNPF